VSKLGDILKTIEDNNKTIEIEYLLDEPPYVMTRNAWQNAITDARVANTKLLNEYRNEALANSVVMFVYGSNDKVDAFLDIAKSEADVFTVRSDGMYREIAMKLESGIGPGRFLVTGQLIDLVQWVVDYARKYDLNSINKIVVESDVAASSFDDVVNVVRNKVREYNGDMFTKLWVANTFSDQLVASQYKGNVVPVVVVVRDEAEAMTLASIFGKHGGTYDLNDAEVSKKFVLDVFQDAMKSSKKRKNSQ
jgi:hypothetical protein